MSRQNSIGQPARVIAGILVGLGFLAVTGPAVAQVSGFYEGDNPSVTVDLSVLNDNGMSPTAGNKVAAGTGHFGLLKMPGLKPPVSRLLVAPPGAGSLPPPAKSRMALAPAERPMIRRPAGPVTPPAEAPASSLNVPSSQPLPPPSAATPPPPPSVSAAAPPPPPVKTAAAPSKPMAAPSKPVAAAAPTPPPPAKAPPPPADVAPPPPPAETPKVAEATPPAAPKPAEQASLTIPTGPLEPGRVTQVLFEASASKLPDSAREPLKKLVGRILDKGNLRLQLLAYAGGESLSSGKARRLSLSRALSVRSFLIESGLRPTRIDVRALGDKTDEEPVNRVDINVVER